MYYALSMEQFYPNPLIAPFLAFHCMRVNVVTAVVVVVVTCHTHPEWRGQSCRRPPPGSTGQCGDTGAGRGGGRVPRSASKAGWRSPGSGQTGSGGSGRLLWKPQRKPDKAECFSFRSYLGTQAIKRHFVVKPESKIPKPKVQSPKVTTKRT